MIAALGSKARDRFEILLGSVAKAPTKVTLELKGLPTTPFKCEVRRVPASNLEAPLAAEVLPQVLVSVAHLGTDGWRITLDKVEENQAYHLLLSR